tara:strand:+ start:14892 stop:15455 length:564 start_codon:yes stop_codon:yes gene_type:complete
MLENPQFVIFTGPMFGSKTTKLLGLLDRLNYQKKKVAVFKASLDDRYSKSEIITHSGSTQPAVCISSGADMLEYLANHSEVYEAVAVDEVFMIDGIADVLIWLYRTGTSVFVSSLTFSSACDVFPEMEKILPWATKIEMCPAVCTTCGSDAFYTYKKRDDGKMISIGGDDLYEARCWNHHKVKREVD